MFVAVQSSCEARVALTSSVFSQAKTLGDIKSVFLTSPFSRSKGGAFEWPSLKWIATDDLALAATPAGGLPDTPQDDDIAFLQVGTLRTSSSCAVLGCAGSG